MIGDDIKTVDFRMAMPIELYRELEAIAASREVSITALFRQFIKLGLLAVKLEDTPGNRLVLHEGEQERELILF